MTAKIRVPNTFQPIDDAIDAAWEPLRHNPIANRIFYTASESANFSIVWHALGVARAISTRDPMLAVRTSAALGLESAIVNGPLKSLFERERPDVATHSRPLSLRQPRTSSFPSGHASAAVVAAGYLNDLYTILGNEAYSDAANPTISVDDTASATEVNTSRFSFEAQVASSLEEELALLRGRDDFVSPGVKTAPG